MQVASLSYRLPISSAQCHTMSHDRKVWDLLQHKNGPGLLHFSRFWFKTSWQGVQVIKKVYSILDLEILSWFRWDIKTVDCRLLGDVCKQLKIWWVISGTCAQMTCQMRFRYYFIVWAASVLLETCDRIGYLVAVTQAIYLVVVHIVIYSKFLLTSFDSSSQSTSMCLSSQIWKQSCAHRLYPTLHPLHLVHLERQVSWVDSTLYNF
jgi:hypothetical protein